MNDKKNRQQGSLLLEAMIAIAVFAVGVLGLFASVQKIFKATEDDRSRDLAAAALDDAASILRSATFSTLYTTYNNAKLPAYGLTGTSGAATVLVQFDVNEVTLPSQYGPVTDLNGDNLKTSTDVSASYLLLPARLTLTYQFTTGTRTEVRYLLIGGN
jgi:Tfp pilus assembly protein PilV